MHKLILTNEINLNELNLTNPKMTLIEGARDVTYKLKSPEKVTNQQGIAFLW